MLEVSKAVSHPTTRRRRSIAAWALLLLVVVCNLGATAYTMRPCFAEADPMDKEVWPSSRKDTNLTREAAEQNLKLPAEVELLARPKEEQKADWKKEIKDVLANLLKPTIWLAEAVLGLLSQILQWITEPLVKFMVNSLFRAMYNPNIAADQPPELARFVKPINNMLKDMAIDLLLLLFILSIWKYWVDHSWKGGNPMAAVGRLIATLALIMAWSTISDFLIHISNDMLAQMMFGTNDRALLENAQEKITTYLAAGLLGGAIAGQFGSFFFFAIISILFYETIYLLVLKSVQTALIVAQYMFAPIFLVFFATPDTENIASGFVKSCIEVSLWTFFWMGFVRILLYILYVDLGFWGNVFMIIGTLQLMLSVPQFMAKAQISPISEFLTGAVLFKSAFSAAKNWSQYMPWTKEGGLLGRGFTSLANWWKRDPGGDSSDPGSPGLPPGPGGAGPTLNPATPTPGGTPGTGTGPPRNTNRFDRTGAATGQGRLNPADAIANANREGPGRLGENDGATGQANFDGNGELAGVTHGENDSAAQRAFRNAKGSLAKAMLRDPAMRAALAAALGTEPPDGRDAAGKQSYNRALGQLAFDAAGAYLNGETGGRGSLRAATTVARNAFGDMDQARRDDLLASMQDSDRADSPFNPNYRQTSQAVDQAGLPRNAATMAFASSPEGSRLRGQALNQAFNALDNAMRPALEAAGFTHGTQAYNEALGRAICGSTPSRRNAMAAVGVGFAGVPAAEQPQTPEEWEAYALQTDNVSQALGIRADQALGRLRGMMGTPAAQADPRPLPDRLATAAQALAAANEQRVPLQGLAANAPLAGQLYELARTHTPANPTLTPQNVYSALTAAKVAGFTNPLNPGDADLVNDMLTPDTGDWRAGEINEANMALARRGQATGAGVNRDVCMRVRAAGLPEALDPIAFTVSAIPEFENVPTARTANGVVAINNECLRMARGHLGAGPTDTSPPVVDMARRLASGDVTGLVAAGPDANFVTANHLSGEDMFAYNEVATQGRANGIHYTTGEVRQARALSGEGYVPRITDAVTLVHNAVSTPTAGGATLSPEVAASGMRYAIDHGFHRSTLDNPNVVGTLGPMVAANDPLLASPGWDAAAAHGAMVLADYTPANIGHLRDLAQAGGVRVAVIGQAEYQDLAHAFPIGTNLSVVSRETIQNVGGAALLAPDMSVSPGDRHTFLHTAGILAGHHEFGAVGGAQYQTVVNMAGDWATHSATSSSTPDQQLQGMNVGTRRVLIAIAQHGTSDSRSLTGGDLVQYVRDVGTVASDLGLRDYGDAVQLVDRVASSGGTFNQARVPLIIQAEQALSSAGGSRDARQDPRVLTVLTEIAGGPDAGRLTELAGVAVNAREVFPGATPIPVAGLMNLANLTRDGGWPGGMSQVEYEVADRIATGGVSPTRQVVERVIQFQAANGGTVATQQQVNLLLNSEAARMDLGALGQASVLLSALAEARLNPTGAAVTLAAADVENQLRTMSGDDIRTVVTLQRNGGAIAARGQDLINLVATVNEAGGNSLTPTMLQAVVNLPAATLNAPDAGAIVARAVELSATPAALGLNTQWIDHMVRECGWTANQISAQDVANCQTVNAVQVGGHAVAPRREFVMKLVQGGVALTPENVSAAHLPSVSALRPHEIGAACQAVTAYVAAPPPAGSPTKMYNDVDALMQDPVFVDTLIGIERIHGQAQCGNANYVEATYQTNLQHPANQNEFRVNVNGRNIRVP